MSCGAPVPAHHSPFFFAHPSSDARDDRLESTEAPDEEPTVSKEQFLELKCNISMSTNYMMQGIAEVRRLFRACVAHWKAKAEPTCLGSPRTQSLEQDIEKNSPTLGRQAVYHETTRVSRLPSYLTVNMVRFYWRRDINKKTKIMRRVKFPFELDATELVTDSLKQKLLPVNEKLKDVDRDRRERAKTRRKTKKRVEQQEQAARAEANGQPAPVQDPNDDPPEQVLADTPMDGELPDEETKRQEELATLLSLVHPDLEADKGANVSGLYDLAGIVSHKGASADGGASCSRPCRY